MKNTVKLGIIVLIAFCVLAVIGCDPEIYPGMLTVENAPAGQNIVTIYDMPQSGKLTQASIGAMIILDGKAAGTGTSTEAGKASYLLVSTEGPFIDSGTFAVGLTNTKDTPTTKYGTVSLNNGNGKIDYSSMKLLSEFDAN